MRPDEQRGFAIVTALFIVVVLAALGAFIATISASQHAGSALDAQSAFAYQAARAGSEWGIDNVVNGSPAAPPDTVTCSATVPAPPIVLDGVTVSVCLQRLASGDTSEIGLVSIWRVTATACNLPLGGVCPGDTTNPNYVERQISVLVE